jgi:hypothetical protein
MRIGTKIFAPPNLYVQQGIGALAVFVTLVLRDCGAV